MGNFKLEKAIRLHQSEDGVKVPGSAKERASVMQLLL